MQGKTADMKTVVFPPLFQKNCVWESSELTTFGMIMCAYSFINMESYIIHLNEEHVWMNGEIGPKGGKIQYKADIHLKDIREISFIRTNRNSRNKSIKRAPQAYPIKRYLVFKKTNGKEVWMNVFHYTNGYLEKNIGRNYFKNNEFFQCL